MKSYLKSTVKSIKIYYTISADPARLILMQLARQNGPARLKQAGPAQSSSTKFTSIKLWLIFLCER